MKQLKTTYLLLARSLGRGHFRRFRGNGTIGTRERLFFVSHYYSKILPYTADVDGKEYGRLNTIWPRIKRITAPGSVATEFSGVK